MDAPNRSPGAPNRMAATPKNEGASAYPGSQDQQNHNKLQTQTVAAIITNDKQNKTYNLSLRNSGGISWTYIRNGVPPTYATLELI